MASVIESRALVRFYEISAVIYPDGPGGAEPGERFMAVISVQHDMNNATAAAIVRAFHPIGVIDELKFKKFDA